jgi:hypothetical protein
MRMDDVVIESVYQSSTVEACEKVTLSMHANRKDFYLCLMSPFFHGRIGLADQVGGDVLLFQSSKKIEKLLFSSPPGLFSVDM